MNRRPLVSVTIAFVLGIIIQYYLRAPIEFIWVVVALNSIFLLLFIYKKSKLIMISLLLAVIFFGALNLEFDYITKSPVNAFVNKNAEIIGDCIQKDVTDNTTYIFNISKIKYKGKSYDLKSKALVKIYKYEGKSLNNKRIKISGKLEIPDKARNPKMFDYNLYLKTQGIHTILNTRYYNIEVLDTGDISFFIKLRHKIKSHIYSGTFRNFPGEEGKVALGIAFGDKKIINEELYEAFRTSGTAHALAVSGLHFGILFMVIDFVLVRFKLREKYKVFVSIFLIWFFALIVGFSPSVIRASSMITLLTISNILDRRYDLFTALSFVCLLNTVANPFMMFNVGFQLSFSAVIAIGVFYKPIYESLGILPEFLRKMIAVTLAAQVGTSPLIAYHFNTFSPIALIINIPVVLLVSIVLPISLVFFITLFISYGIAEYMAFIDRILIKLLVWVNSLSSYFPFSKFNVISPSFLFILLFYISLILIFYRTKIPYVKKLETKSIFITLLAVIFAVNFFTLMFPKKLKLTFVDVGQGDCILIETPRGKKILVDGGEDEYNFLPEFLLKNGISRIDLICASHIHHDHIGGIAHVARNMKVDLMTIGTKQYSSEEWEQIESECYVKDIPIIEFNKGKSIAVEENLTLKSIYPGAEVITNTHDDINNVSQVLVLEYKDFKALLTGDVEKEAEKEIIGESQRIDIDVLKVGHHGSNTSSTSDFIDFFAPEIAVIQVGKNVFGHPNRETLDKLNERGIKTYRNDKSGAVIIETDGKNISIKTMLD